SDALGPDDDYTVSLGNAGLHRRITHLGNGYLYASDDTIHPNQQTDAVNAFQLTHSTISGGVGNVNTIGNTGSGYDYASSYVEFQITDDSVTNEDIDNTDDYNVNSLEAVDTLAAEGGDIIIGNPDGNNGAEAGITLGGGRLSGAGAQTLASTGNVSDIAIGNGASATGSDSTAIGEEANSSAQNATALGSGADASG
ncbi:MAG: hypothetical protein GY698_17430, partial [Actinomycetia bacterium]|nr:hypothetical protein [Actinomycetes bacterium]